MSTDRRQLALSMAVQDKMVELANLYEELTTSDLQGVAHVEAIKVINMVKAHVAQDAVAGQRTVSQFATAAECAAYNLVLRDFAASLER